LETHLTNPSHSAFATRSEPIVPSRRPLKRLPSRRRVQQPSPMVPPAVSSPSPMPKLGLTYDGFSTFRSLFAPSAEQKSPLSPLTPSSPQSEVPTSSSLDYYSWFSMRPPAVVPTIVQWIPPSLASRKNVHQLKSCPTFPNLEGIILISSKITVPLAPISNSCSRVGLRLNAASEWPYHPSEVFWAFTLL
jgi:hypothetical protein